MKVSKWGIALFLVLCTLMVGCTQDVSVMSAAKPSQALVSEVKKVAVPDINEVGLKDDPSLYSAYDPTDPVCFYITVRKGSEADGTDHTFAEVNSYNYDPYTADSGKILAEAIFQVGDERGPLPGEVGYGAIGVNATINARGRTSTKSPQKSYRISLLDNAGLWRGQRDIAINKHPFDPTRFRNMLYFELLRDVPGMVSLRTQFVHVYIKDETDPAAPDGFEDCGMFTQVELPNSRYLRNHGLSRNGNMYKANFCEMYRYPDQLRLATDPEYDVNSFSKILETKTGDDHSKLLEMLDAVNDYTIPIEETVNRYFDLDNLTSYLAFNTLMGNADSCSQNYLLYSPVNSDTWYYICWDGDGSLVYYESELLGYDWTAGGWKRGISNYWGVLLFNRMLKVAVYREAVNAKVEALHKIITPARIASLIQRYRKVVDRFTKSMPDAINMQIPEEKMDLVYENMIYDTDRAYQYYIESLKKPMPFYLNDAIVSGVNLNLSWGDAYDFGGDFVRYDVQVATDWTFMPLTIVWESLGQLSTMASTNVPLAGTYYWRVVATNESGFSQMAFDQVTTAKGKHIGMRSFTIREDGTVINGS